MNKRLIIYLNAQPTLQSIIIAPPYTKSSITHPLNLFVSLPCTPYYKEILVIYLLASCKPIYPMTLKKIDTVAYMCLYENESNLVGVYIFEVLNS